MPEEPYSTREIKQLFKAADERADAFHGTLMQRMDDFEIDTRNSLARQEIKLDSIEKQTKLTNGRVNQLERYMLIVGVAVIVIIALKLPELLPALKFIL